MITAIYARKSTDEGDKSEDAKSITRQIERCREYAARKGWTVVDEHIYSDDGVSGTEFVKRPGLQRLLAALSPRPPFHALIVSEQSRIGRDTIRTLATIQRIQDSGVRIFSYLDDREITLEADTDEVQEFIRGWSAAQESRKASQRTRDALRKKAEQGFVTGGEVFGYQRVREGSHVKRVIHEPEATIVRRIFGMVAEGMGLLKITKTLNVEGATSPNGRGWATTTVRGMLDRDLYRGRVTWGRTRTLRRGGTKQKAEAPDAQVIVREMPELRIVPEPLWKAAHARLARTRQTYTGHRRMDNGQLNGRPESGLISKHLLASHLRCGQCGATLFVATRVRTDGKVHRYYLCQTHHKQGAKRGCSNRFAIPYEEITRKILGHFKDLEMETLDKLLIDAIERQKADIALGSVQRTSLQADIQRLDAELARLADTIALGSAPATIVKAIESRERDRATLTAKLEHLDGLMLDEDLVPEKWRGWVLPHMLGMKAALEQDPATARAVMRELLVEPVVVTPTLDDRGRLVAWEYLGQGVLDRVLSGKVLHSNNPPSVCAISG